MLTLIYELIYELLPSVLPSSSNLTFGGGGGGTKAEICPI